MSYGIRTKNLQSGYTTIDDKLRSYRYLGKFLIPSQIGWHPTVEFDCVGFPQVYHDVPYNITSEEDLESPFTRMISRTGISLEKLENLGGNRWRATFALTNFNGPNYQWYLRVFGRLDLNPVPSAGYGLRVRNLETKEVIFDSGCRPLRLAGDTYNTELVLDFRVPDRSDSTAIVDQYDTWVDLPFNMAGKSIHATARGLIHWPYYAGTYIEDGQSIYYYDVCSFQTLYWANGSRLYARRGVTDLRQLQTYGPTSIDISRCQVVYSRLAVIDNSQFP